MISNTFIYYITRSVTHYIIYHLFTLSLDTLNSRQFKVVSSYQHHVFLKTRYVWNENEISKNNSTRWWFHDKVRKKTRNENKRNCRKSCQRDFETWSLNQWYRFFRLYIAIEYIWAAFIDFKCKFFATTEELNNQILKAKHTRCIKQIFSRFCLQMIRKSIKFRLENRFFAKFQWNFNENIFIFFYQVCNVTNFVFYFIVYVDIKSIRFVFNMFCNIKKSNTICNISRNIKKANILSKNNFKINDIIEIITSIDFCI